MNEAALAGQVERLTRSVRRWRLATLILGILLLSSLGTSGTVITMLILRLSECRDVQQVPVIEHSYR